MFALIEHAFLSILASAIPASTVIVLCATGVLLNERVGVLNLGQEGLIGVGAVFAVISVQSWGVESSWLALLVGMCGAAVMGSLFAVGTVVVRANQVLLGLALALGGVGLANQLGTNRNGTPIPTTSLFTDIDPGGAFTSNDVLEALLAHDPITYLAYLVLPAVLWFVLFRTRHGMTVRAVGESPAAADAVGASVTGIRFAYTVLGSAISGAAGAYMVLTITPTWSPDIARGRGWVSLAVVIFAAWRPFRVVAGALLFGAMISFETTAKARSWDLPFMSAGDMGFLLSMLPYLVTLLVILVPAGAARLGRRSRATDAPAALALPYFREER
ncbi:MAG: ABC transporter permease [Acidimicrobiales bacterium]|nr:ABC transporter permease [Acidimicrobiales bacterium]MCB9393389.1 ABC transporter permease [Acidimicrobiaceae bacterium]